MRPGGARGPGALASSLASAPPLQAWLTEIQEHAQDDVVLMLLGNKVETPSLAGEPGVGVGGDRGQLSPRFLRQVDSAQERAVKREDAEKLAKVSWGGVGGGQAPQGYGT